LDTDTTIPDTNETTRVDALYSNISVFLQDAGEDYNQSLNTSNDVQFNTIRLGDGSGADIIIDPDVNGWYKPGGSGYFVWAFNAVTPQIYLGGPNTTAAYWDADGNSPMYINVLDDGEVFIGDGGLLPATDGTILGNSSNRWNLRASQISSDDWTNVTITQSQISDLSFTDTNETTRVDALYDNITAFLLDTDTTYSALSEFTDDIGFFSDIGNFTGTLTSSQHCRYDGSEIDCDVDVSGWDQNAADDFSGAYADLTGKPTIPSFDQDLNSTDDVDFNTVTSAGNMTITGAGGCLTLPGGGFMCSNSTHTWIG
jgi:hypothetical protein